MKLKTALVLSITLNAALGISLMRRPPLIVEQTPKFAEPASPSSTPAPRAPASSTPAADNSAGRRFRWDSVESPDYRQYIANLRSIGCPDETIRDIIIADVSKLYSEKKKQVSGPAQRFEFWKATSPFLMGANPEKMQKMQALDNEKNEVLRALGIEPDFKTQASSVLNPLDTMFDFIPEEKRAQVMKLMTDMQTRMAKDMEASGGTDETSIVRAQADMEKALKQILSPQEALEYDLRMSMTANMMRNQIAGFDPSEEEFMKVFQLRKAFDDEFSPLSRGSETDEQRKAREAKEKVLQQQIKESLGEERYADYERAGDFAFQQMLRSAKRGDLGVAEAEQVYDLKKAAELRAGEVRKNSDLSRQDRAAALEAVRRDTEAAIQATLGEKGWNDYSKGNGGSYWLRAISPDKKAPPANLPAPVPTQQ